MNGKQEVPPGNPKASGEDLTLSMDGKSLRFVLKATRLKDKPVAAHIHLRKLGKAGPVLITLEPKALKLPAHGTVTAKQFTKARGLPHCLRASGVGRSPWRHRCRSTEGAAAMPGKTVVRQPGEGNAYWMLGGLYEVKVAGPETDGALTIMEMTMPAGMGPPPHTHPGAESVYVIEGEIRYHIDGQTFEGGPGSCFHIPAGTLENFEPIETSRIIVAYTPGGIEGFFNEAGEPAERRELPPVPTAPPDIERLVAIGEKYGMQIAPPAAV